MFISTIAHAQAQPTTNPARPDPTKPIDLATNKTLYVVGYSHLDTQWRWAYPLVIREYIPNTMLHNFAYFERYPKYVFNFSGSRRYEMMREYYPKDYERLKQYIASGQWFVCGSSVDENDAIVPSSESQVRHVLYGNRFARTEFGKESAEFMLPDCFGFPASLPTILAHCGIAGFSTQKLTWGSAVGIPFKVGVWEGVDGSGVIAALDPGSYVGNIKEDLSLSESWLTRINNTGTTSGVYADYHYYGTGDRGGAPQESAVQWMEKSVDGDGPLNIVSATAEKMFLDITPAQREALPRYRGEFLLTEHSAGSVTSQAYMKRWNRRNELLADAAERASVAAMWLGGLHYPSKTLYDAWVLVLGSQMHDMLPGTSLPKCYEYCWNDELLALNQFASVTQSGVGVIASQMDTQRLGEHSGPGFGFHGVPLVVYNPLSIEREDVVVAHLPRDLGEPAVFGPDAKEVPSQVIAPRQIAFLAKVPPVGCAVFEVRRSGVRSFPSLKIGEKSLENARFRVTLNDAGDIASIFDKQANREVLSAPSRLAFLYENPSAFPAWNMDWNDRQHPPRSYVTGHPTFRMIELGPVRVTIEVTRESEGSRFVQRISLCAGGAGDRVIVSNIIDWQTRERSLKATFPLTVSNPNASYQIGVGVMERGNNEPKKFEVPQHFWFDLSDADEKYGVAILNDSKYGSDKPSNNELRLTLIYTPGVRGGYRDQATQDIGRHEITYAIAPHVGNWRDGNVQWNAARLNQPLMAFRTPQHDGPLGKSFSMFKVSDPNVAIDAIKKAEDSDEIIVRLKELAGREAREVRLTAATRFESAREVTGQEKSLAPAQLRDDAIVIDMKPFSLRAFAIRLATLTARTTPATMQPVDLPFDLDVISTDDDRTSGAFDREGRTYPAEQLPAQIESEGITFTTGRGGLNAVACKGQTLALPRGFTRVYVLASAVDGDQTGTFTIGQRSINQRVQNWGGYIGQWDNRLWTRETPETSTEVAGEYCGLVPGFVKRDAVAWFCSHRHHPKNGNEFYQYSYLFKYGFDIPNGATSITLPDNDRIRVFAMTVARDTHDATIAAGPLYDTLEGHRVERSAARIVPNGGSFNDITYVTINHPLYWHAGGLRYTIDGSEPTMNSPAYERPVQLSSSARVRVKQFDQAGNGGSEASAQFDVDDTTRPRVKSITAVARVPSMRIEFTEPVRRADAEHAPNYTMSNELAVTGAALSEDGLSATLALVKPPADDARISLSIRNVRDMSPNGNAVSATPNDVTLARPILALVDAITCDGQSSKEIQLDGVPTKGRSPFSLNLFVRMNEELPNRTLIAGFGRADDSSDGTGRYIAKFASGVHFWAKSRDVSGRRNQFDLGKWQMITATYDGQTLQLYKNGQRISHRDIELADDDQSIVRIAPVDPWDEQRRFKGEIRNFTIWNTAIPPEAVSVLAESMPSEPTTGSGK